MQDLNELAESFLRGNVVLFVGADLAQCAGLPGWIELIRPLAQSVGYQLPDQDRLISVDHLLTAAQRYANQNGYPSLLRRLRDALDTTGIRPTPAHKLIASLPVKVIFSTYYDNLVERALEDAGHRLYVIVGDLQLGFWDEKHSQVVKLYGDLYRPESIVLAKRDFNTYSESHRRLVEQLRTTLETKTALFLGFNMQDPFFDQIWDSIGQSFGAFRQMGYALIFDVDPPDATDLQARGIHPINLETKGRKRGELIAEWLTALINLIVGSSQSQQMQVYPLESLATDNEVIDRLRRIEDKIDRGYAEERQAADHILEAIAHNQVEQNDMALIVEELRAWARQTQQTGIPMSQELRSKLETLSEPSKSGSVSQYLELAIPIIPGILSYNIDLGTQNQVSLKAIWEQIKTRFGKDSKSKH